MANSTKKTAKAKPVVRAVKRWLRKASKLPWSSIALRGSAIVGLLIVEIAVAQLVGHAASDALTGTILIVAAGLAGLGVVLGPSMAVSFRSKSRRNTAWLVVAACLTISTWNLSSTLENGQRQAEARTVRQSEDYAGDVARYAALNRMIDALADEQFQQDTLANTISERDRLQPRIDAANPEPVTFAGFSNWLKAILFHGLVAGFSAAFAVPLVTARRTTTAKGQKPRGVVREDDNVAFAQF